MKWEKAGMTDWSHHKANDIRGALGLFLSGQGNKLMRKSKDRLAKQTARQYHKVKSKERMGSIATNHSFTVGEAIEALKRLPRDETLWVRSTGLTGCGYIGYTETIHFGSSEPSNIVVCQPLSPEQEEANRKFKKGQTP